MSPTLEPKPAQSQEREVGRFVGTSLPRTDAPAKVTGEALFTMDLEPGRLLHVKLVTSPVPHATLDNVDTAAAEAVDGVSAVITAEDVPNTRRGKGILDQPILANEKVRFIGEPIAAVAAETPEIAADAASKVEIDLTECPAVFDVDSAFERDAPAIHPDVRSYDVVWPDRDHIPENDPDFDRLNVLYKEEKKFGDVDAAMKSADHVVEATYEARPFQHAAMEPHIAICRVAQNGETTIWTSKQIPHVIEHDLLERYPDIRPGELTIRTPFVGGGFGGKGSAFLETILIGLARKTAPRPVRLALTRAEEFTVAPGRAAAKIRLRDGVTEDGQLVARDVDIRFDSGAYNEYVFRVVLFSPAAVYSTYDIPNVRYACHQVYTNRPRTIAFRGFGKTQVFWAVERHMDRVARELGLDPLEYRQRNLIREGDELVDGEVMGPNDTEGCLRLPAESIRSIDLEETYPAYSGDEWVFGRGFAYGVKPVPRSVSTVTVHIQRDMTVEVHVGAPDIGQGSNTVLTQLAAEEFGIDPENIRIVAGDTDRTAYDRGPTGSRFTYHAGKALRMASSEVKEKLFQLASEKIDGVDPEGLETEAGQVFPRGNPANGIHVNELFTTYDHPNSFARKTLAIGGELIGTATYDSEVAHACWTGVGGAALVAVNTLTGQTDLLKYVTAADVGYAINPSAVKAQFHGAVGQGIAGALYEEIVYDNGNPINPNFKDYRIPAATELPYDHEVILFESHDDVGPDGAKGVGEAGMMASGPAVGNAVADALGMEFDTMPITPEIVLEALIETEGAPTPPT